MNFSYRTESIQTAALDLSYFLVPWDTEIFGKPVAQISTVRVIEPRQAALDYRAFADWCAQQRIELCSCRVPADRLADSMFLEERGFRFIELNYLPQLTDLQARRPSGVSGLRVVPADASNRDELADMAAQVFRFGRLHQDPRVAPELGDRRYRAWMTNAFSHPRQHVLKCIQDRTIVAFFVLESPQPNHCFWSLIGLAPGLQGKGLGKQVWNAVLDHHREQGVEVVSTSISSLNVAVLNLYVSLGFRFPQPSITLQWRPVGTAVLS